MTLEELYSELNRVQKMLNDYKKKRQGYMDKAEKCKALYKRVLEDKEVVEGYRKSVKTLRNEKFDSFEGYQHKNVYKETMKDLMEAYDTLIDDLDTNADRLNWKRTEWQNKAYTIDGPIGWCTATINNLWTLIQNFVN